MRMAGPINVEHCTQRERLGEPGTRAAISVSVDRSPSRSHPDGADSTLSPSPTLGEVGGGDDAGSGGDDAGSGGFRVSEAASTDSQLGFTTPADTRGAEWRNGVAVSTTGGRAGGTIVAAVRDDGTRRRKRKGLRNNSMYARQGRQKNCQIQRSKDFAES